MKRLLLITSVVALSLTSCSDEHLKDAPNSRPIDFRAKTMSRATVTDQTNLTTFYVSAFNESGIYDGIDNLAFTANDGFWSSATPHYWPETGSLYFRAYAPANTAEGKLNGTLLLTKDNITLTGFAPRYKVEKQIDFVHAYATGSKANERSGVELPFNHALSQIEVLAKNNGDKKFTIAGIKIVGAYNQGDFSLDGGWNVEGKTKGSYKITTDPVVLYDQADDAEALSLMGTAGPAMLIPQQLTAWDYINDTENANHGAYIALKLNLKDATGTTLFPKDPNADAYGWVAVPISTNWEAGKKYVYTLDFTKGAGVVVPPAGGDGSIDPGTPGDPNDEDKPGDPDEDEKNPGGTGENKPGPGDSVIGLPIKFTVSVSPWTEITDTPGIDL